MSLEHIAAWHNGLWQPQNALTGMLVVGALFYISRDFRFKCGHKRETKVWGFRHKKGNANNRQTVPVRNNFLLTR